MSSRKKILVAMSGGVDSSVAACLLHEQGYDVTGVFMRLGAEPAAETCESPATVSLPLHPAKHQGCCSAADATDARLVAGKLGIPFFALNFEREFSRLIDYFADEYAAARTPNPCVRCNQDLKFGRLVAYADSIEAVSIATGHYARVVHGTDRSRLLRARFTEKDQSYVLFGITQAVLRRTMFPLGDLTKDEVRAHARRFGLALAEKPESQDICFAPDRDYARVVKARRPEAFAPGEIRHADGRLLGTHEGIPNFTVGQRRGLRVAVGTPVYVSSVDRETATVTVGPQESIRCGELTASQIYWHGEVPSRPLRAMVRIRYNHEAAPAEVIPIAGDRVSVRFDEPQWAITPGQALVLYDNDEVLAGGWIDGRS